MTGVVEPTSAPQPERDVLDLDALDLAVLRRRTSVKWRALPPDVLPAFVAEMDYPVARPVRRALHAMVAAGDLGYPALEVPYRRLPEAFASWAAGTLGWRPDPADVLVLGRRDGRRRACAAGGHRTRRRRWW